MNREIIAWDARDPWPRGNRLLLIGPPGTGKTRNVLEVYVYPLLRAGARVLACSFSRAAAQELRQRTAVAIGGSEESWKSVLSTIHSEAARRTRHLGIQMGGPSKPKEMGPTDGDSIDLDQAEHLAEIERRGDRDAMAAWDYVRQVWPEDRRLAPRARLSRILYGEDLDRAEAAVQVDLNQRHEDGRLTRPDFTGLLELALDHGAGRPLDLLAVDEAQDLPPLQWAVIDLWAQEARRLLVVGDPDQAIYGWAGADGQRLLRWIREGDPTRRLAQSWRVPPAVHRLARRIVSEIGNREDAPYQPSDRDGEVRSVEAREAWAEVASAQEAGRTVLVLSRTRAGLTQAVDELVEDGVPHVAERGASLLRRDGGPFRLACALSSWCWWNRLADLADARKFVASIDTRGELMAGHRGAKGRLVKALAATEDQPVPLGELATHGVSAATLTAQWADPDPEWWGRNILASSVAAHELLSVRDWLAQYGDAERLIAAADLVRATTAHGSKGREAELVVLDARRSAWFGDRRGGRPEPRPVHERRDEDLRVLYVAVTRAKGDLLVIRGEDRDWFRLHGLSLRG